MKNTVTIEVSRNPSKEEIKFGLGCTIYNYAEVPLKPSDRPKSVTVEGKKYRVPR